MDDQREERPRTEDFLREPTREKRLPAGGPTATLLDALLEAVNGVGEDAEEELQRLLKEARQQSDRVAFEIARRLGGCEPRDYPYRWGLIYVASELRSLATLPLLSNVVLTPIPPEESADPHSFSTVAEETILRTTAVEGVALLAPEHERAGETLWEFLQVNSLSVRRAAVQAILGIGGDDKGVRERLMRVLPEDQRFLVDLKRVEVTDVEQIRHPEEHLSEEGREAKTDEPPRLPGEGRKGAPKAFPRK